MSKVVYLSVKEGTPAEGYWDQAFIGDLLDGLPDSERTVVIIPGAYQSDVIDEINARLAEYPKVLVFITSDEEHNFPVDKLSHPDMQLLTQYGEKNSLPLGYTPQARKILREIGYRPKDVSYFYAGQINHIRREQMAEQLKSMEAPELFRPSEGFGKGLDHDSYFYMLAKSRVIPCPPGNVTQDSFRVYEALEAGAVPVLDKFSAQGNNDYWDRVLPGAPLPIISDWKEFPEVMEQYQSLAARNRIFAWWIGHKQDLRRKIKKLLNINEAMTIVVPTSPIPSHPSTEIIEETIKSIRHHTAMDIIITIDGVREEQAAMRKDYEEYIARLLWKCNFEWDNVTPMLFTEHMHQSGMMKAALEKIETPLVMYVEHDTPLTTDREIDWGGIAGFILSNEANVVRFHFEEVIPQEHEYLMVHEKDVPGFIATKQWSQRPHVARAGFYREVMKFFSDKSNCFIEDLVYGRCVEGEWDHWRLFIYAPDPKQLKRSINLDGRAGGTKYEKEQIW